LTVPEGLDAITIAVNEGDVPVLLAKGI